MKTSVPHRVRTLVVPAILLAAMGTSSALAADGVIHFVGAIVAAPYEITRPEASRPTPDTIIRGTQGEVVFGRQWVDRPSARLAIRPAGAQAIDLVFVDSIGRRRTADATGSLAIDRDGGRLSVARPPPASGTASGTATALLTVTYD